MFQRWHDLLFAHWPVPTSALRGLIPEALEIERFDGSAWIGVVPFRMSGIRLRGTPAIPGLRAFPELNLRTYVTDGTRSGVWFFSLDAKNAVAVAVARRWYHLPYFRARMACDGLGDGIEYRSERVHRGAPAASLVGRYRPTGPTMETTRPGSFDHWLTERYCLYARDPRGGIWRGEIDHAPWPLQPAEAELEIDGLTEGWGISLPDRDPVLHFARQLNVRAWRLVRVP